jgi:hypothetical protein
VGRIIATGLPVGEEGGADRETGRQAGRRGTGKQVDRQTERENGSHVIQE